MPNLSKDKREEYVRDRGVFCPLCGSDHILSDEEELNIEFEDVTHKVHCYECHAQWLDVYQLKDIKLLDLGKNERPAEAA